MLGRQIFGNEANPSRIKLIVLCTVILLFGIFLGMNSTPTPVWIFGWKPSLPLIVIALICFLLGCGCGWAFTVIYRRKTGDE